MGKLAQIKELIDEAKSIVEETTADVSEAVASYNTKLEEIKVLQESLASHTLSQIESSLSNLQNAPELLYEPEVIEESMEILEPLQAPEPFEIQEPRAGLLQAKFWGFVTFLLTLVVLLGIGIFMRHISFAALQSNLENTLSQSASFFSSLLVQSPHAGPAFGTVLILIVSLALGYGVYWILASKAARYNIAQAQNILEQAREWSHERREFLQKIQEVTKFLNDVLFALQGVKLFGEEFSARVKRARFFDGSDFTTLPTVAQGEVSTLQNIAAKAQNLAKLQLYAQDFIIAQSVRSAIDDAKALINSIKVKIYG
ncbi:hypothetical protein [Nitratiruptor sp. YY09-18]|uniref:hypothetical protein n=1 Tax=Nitratiruptor sp. YY09-18 TaxID=2724901 RepID=UPI001914E028|nr:hypothetical protein [Nitratiruptor sp. YY09-18]BCD68923.1 hypothetical protein NitYY0918_C1846 [Nitratiruptor sp. YY09-18]